MNHEPTPYVITTKRVAAARWIADVTRYGVFVLSSGPTYTEAGVIRQARRLIKYRNQTRTIAVPAATTPKGATPK